jgi:hypothetical protein
MLVLCEQDYWRCVQNIKLDQRVVMQCFSDIDLQTGILFILDLCYSLFQNLAVELFVF